MSDPSRSGYAVSAGNSGDTTTTTISMTASIAQPTSDLATAIMHLRAVVAVLERIAAQ